MRWQLQRSAFEVSQSPAMLNFLNNQQNKKIIRMRILPVK
jgi:hypothetical protein